jgi:hypothetical protein
MTTTEPDALLVVDEVRLYRVHRYDIIALGNQKLVGPLYEHLAFNPILDELVGRPQILVVDDPVDLEDVLAQGLILVESGEGLGHRVHERDFAVLVGDDHRVGDAFQDGGKPLLPFFQFPLHVEAVDRHLDGAVQLGVLKGLDDVAEGLGELGAVQGVLVGVGGEKDDRDAGVFADIMGHVDAVHLALEHDVHQHQVGGEFLGAADRFLARTDDVDHVIPEPFETALDVFGDYILVFDNKDFQLLHEIQPFSKYLKRMNVLYSVLWRFAEIPALESKKNSTPY